MTESNQVLIAIHWDGYPESFGIELLHCKNYTDIYELGKKHSIDFLSAKMKFYLQRETQAKNTNSHFSKNDTHYVDFPEWQYEKKGNIWMCRPVTGFWPHSHLKDEYKPIASYLHK